MGRLLASLSCGDAVARAQLAQGLTLPADEAFLRYRAGQILVEKLDGPAGAAETRGS